MRGINEHIARMANKEDGCTGRFWEGRFKSQALLDEAALLTCMSYVDLNPIRAGMAKTPEVSDFTSIQERIKAIGSTNSTAKTPSSKVIPTPEGLMPFVGSDHIDKEQGIPFAFADYLELTDWAGRAIRDDKKSAIPCNLAPILERLNIAPDAWLHNIQHYGCNYYRAVGSVAAIKQYSEVLGQQWLCGLKAAQHMYKAAPT